MRQSRGLGGCMRQCKGREQVEEGSMSDEEGGGRGVVEEREG